MKNTKKILLISLIVLGITSCKPNKQEPTTSNDSQPISNLIKQNVVLANGIAFETGELISVDPYNGEEIAPCYSSQTVTNSKDNSKKPSISSCKNPVLIGSKTLSNTSLSNALKISEEPIIGTVSINGEEKEARFVVTVTALYKGSHCTTTYAAGFQRTNCINKELRCAALRAAMKNPNYPC